jgi:hypothetical protein
LDLECRFCAAEHASLQRLSFVWAFLAAGKGLFLNYYKVGSAESGSEDLFRYG